MNSRTLARIATLAFFVPVGIAVLSKFLIWIIPGCNPNPYSIEGCVVFSISLAKWLVLGLLGGIFAAVTFGIFVSLPLSLFALQLLRKERASNEKA
jgi:hypothetical protein